MNIVLIGYRGTGKSTIGKILAEKLGMKVLSTDELIVRRAGKRIPEIVAESGWDRFRDIESEVIRDVSAMDNIVVDAGGGVIIRPQNVEALRKNGKVFWLTAQIKTIAKRIHTDTERPSLTGNKSFIDEISEVLKQREPLYKEAAHHVIKTDNRKPEKIAEEIAEKVTGNRLQPTGKKRSDS